MNSINQKKSIESPSFPPLGLLYVASSLIDEGYNAEVLDLSLENNPLTQLERSLNGKDAVGISVTSYSYNEVDSIAEKIKEKDPSIPVIIDGPHCSFRPRQSLIDVPNADIAVKGDGENTIKEIIQTLNGNKKLSNISGVYYQKKNKINHGKPAEIINDLDTIPFPARHLVDKYDYGKINDTYFLDQRLHQQLHLGDVRFTVDSAHELIILKNLDSDLLRMSSEKY